MSFDSEELLKREFNTLRGKVCSVIEAMGMPHSQERAAIHLIKQYTYETQQNLDNEIEEL